MKKHLFTSESVSRGHPDKICDQISDKILDYCLTQNPNSRVATEVMANKDKIIIAGEIKGIDINKQLEDKIKEESRKLLAEIGCKGEKFNSENVEFDFYLHQQSDNISQGVDRIINKTQQKLNDIIDEKQEKKISHNITLGAGDQGMVFGYANKETEHLMPSSIYYSHLILRKIEENIKKNKRTEEFGPDAKSQVTLNYENGKPVSFHTIIVSLQHHKDTQTKEVEDFVTNIIEEISNSTDDKTKLLTDKTKILINQTGAFIIGGPESDVGLTGRKIIVDTYGGYAPHGGGAFSGKDATKIDRSGCYMTRYLAKNIVNANIAEECLVQLAYCIGRAEPVSVYVKLTDNNKNTAELTELEQIITKFIDEEIQLTPQAMIDKLELTRPIFFPSSYYGHFGRKHNPEKNYFTWEKLDLTDEINKYLKNN